MYKTKQLLVIIITFILFGCSEAENTYNIENKQNFVPPLSKVNTENFTEFPFYDVPQWRYDIAKYQGPYSESGDITKSKIL